jgi:hypothetical protein
MYQHLCAGQSVDEFRPSDKALKLRRWRNLQKAHSQWMAMRALAPKFLSIASGWGHRHKSDLRNWAEKQSRLRSSKGGGRHSLGWTHGFHRERVRRRYDAAVSLVTREMLAAGWLLQVPKREVLYDAKDADGGFRAAHSYGQVFYRGEGDERVEMDALKMFFARFEKMEKQRLKELAAEMKAAKHRRALRAA